MEKESKKTKPIKGILECPECKSKNILTGRKEPVRWCRRCGFEWKK